MEFYFDTLREEIGITFIEPLHLYDTVGNEILYATKIPFNFKSIYMLFAISPSFLREFYSESEI